MPATDTLIRTTTPVALPTLKMSTDSKTSPVVVKRYNKAGAFTKHDALPNAFGHAAGRANGGCPGATDECEAVCYVEGTRRYKAVGALLDANLSVVLALSTEANHGILASLYADLMRSSAAAQTRKGIARPLVRYEWSGDIVNEWHARAIAQACRMVPTVSAWLYTRSLFSLPIVAGIPSLRVLVSADNVNVAAAESMATLYGLQVAYMGTVAGRTRSTRTFTCPAQVKGNVVATDRSPSGWAGICSVCRKCVDTVATPDYPFSDSLTELHAPERRRRSGAPGTLHPVRRPGHRRWPAAHAPVRLSVEIPRCCPPPTRPLDRWRSTPGGVQKKSAGYDEKMDPLEMWMALSPEQQELAWASFSVAQQKGLRRLIDARVREQRVAGYVADPVLWVRERAAGETWSKVEEIMRSVRDNQRTVVRSCHGVGKALALDTPVATPAGWRLMGDLQVGDEVFGEDGKPTEVVWVSPVWRGREMFRVRFDDGSSVVADGDHLWDVSSFRARHRVRAAGYASGGWVRDWRDHWALTESVSTRDLAGSLLHGKQRNWAVPCALPLEGGEPLTFSAYALGVWLGDGTARDGYITCGAEDVAELSAQLGAEGLSFSVVAVRPGVFRVRVDGLFRWLRLAGLLSNKHVPDWVLRAPVGDRLAALQGLMDTDGWASDAAAVSIQVTDERLARGVFELVVSLGWKPRWTSGPAVLDGRVVGTRFGVCFTPDRPVFRFARKAARQRVRVDPRTSLRMVVAVEPVGVGDSVCITVASPTHRFLAGRSMVPTHNSWTAAQVAVWWIDVHPPGEAVVVTSAPTFPQVKAILWKEIGRAHHAAKAPGRVLTTDWMVQMEDGRDELVAFGRKPADHNVHGFQGIHARYVLVVLDEACGIPQQLWVAAQAIATNANSRLLAIGNPDDATSNMAKICQEGSSWNVIGVSAFDTPNFTGEVVSDRLREMLVDASFVDSILEICGGDTSNPIYQSKVLGQFSLDSPDAVIPLSILHRGRETEWVVPDDLDIVGGTPHVIGVDVGGGGDPTVIRERKGRTFGGVWRRSTPEQSDVVGFICEVANSINTTGRLVINVDEIGLGWGVPDRLRELKRVGAVGGEIRGINVSDPSYKPDVYENLKAELMWTFRLQLQRGEWNTSGLDDRTFVDLSAPKYKITGQGRIMIEPKEKTKERLGRSPDDGDATLLATIGMAPMAAVHGGAVGAKLVTAGLRADGW